MGMRIYVGLLAAGLLIAAVSRLAMIMPGIAPRKPIRRVRGEPTYLLIVLGSGGHTAEMLQLLRNLDTATYTFRRYVVSSGDAFSAEAAVSFEAGLAQVASATKKSYGWFDVQEVTRARRIHQGLLSTPFTAAICAWDCCRILYHRPSEIPARSSQRGPFPDLILTNGPATATILILVSIFLRFMGTPHSAAMMRCVYVESWARVKQLSLSGRILLAIGACDRFVVQWQMLVRKGVEFRGQLVA